MRLGIKFSSLVVLAALCFAPAAFGRASLTGHSDHGRTEQWGNGGNGCTGGQGGGWGWDADRHDDGWGGGGNGGGCTPVPEGGTAVAYLLLAGTCCVGVMAMRSRRPRVIGESN